jgi:hypothetical protein
MMSERTEWGNTPCALVRARSERAIRIREVVVLVDGALQGAALAVRPRINMAQQASNQRDNMSAIRGDVRNSPANLNENCSPTYATVRTHPDGISRI